MKERYKVMTSNTWNTKELSSLRKALRRPPSSVTAVLESQPGGGGSGGVTLPSILYTWSCSPAAPSPSSPITAGQRRESTNTNTELHFIWNVKYDHNYIQDI